MRLLIACTVVVAVTAAIGIVTGRYGTAHFFLVLVGLGFLLRPLALAGMPVQLGPQSGLIVVFWMAVVVFAGPACTLYLVRRRLRTGYVIVLTLWTAVYLWSLLDSTRFSDWP
jgi:hypothetical protein